jgi:hypothetical protein
MAPNLEDEMRGGAGRGLALEYLAAARRARKARRSCGASGDGQRRGGSEERLKSSKMSHFHEIEDKPLS